MTNMHTFTVGSENREIIEAAWQVIGTAVFHNLDLSTSLLRQSLFLAITRSLLEIDRRGDRII